MLREFLIPFALVLFLPHLIHAHSEDHQCKGEIQGEKLEITKKSNDTIFNIPEDCTTLEIHSEKDVTEINWETVERVSLPKLKNFILYLTRDNSSTAKIEIPWKMISLFGDDPKALTKLRINSYCYINNEQVFNFDAGKKSLTINSIDPKPIINAFVGQDDVQLKTLVLRKTRLEDTEFLAPDGVTTLKLDNVKAPSNFSAFVQKFNSLQKLSVFKNFEEFDISDIAQSKKLIRLDITNATLISSVANSENYGTLKTLILTDNIEEALFKKNAWKLMPKLTTLVHTGDGKLDITDLLVYTSLTHLSISKASLTCNDTNPTIKSEILKTLILADCNVDKTFKENAWKVMPNLTTLVHSAPDKFDLSDLLVYKNLKKISIDRGILTFTKPTEQFNTLETLELTNCEFDDENFVDVAASTFPNLKVLTVDARSGGTQPTHDFVTQVQSKIPNIQRVSVTLFQ